MQNCMLCHKTRIGHDVFISQLMVKIYMLSKLRIQYYRCIPHGSDELLLGLAGGISLRWVALTLIS